MQFTGKFKLDMKLSIAIWSAGSKVSNRSRSGQGSAVSFDFPVFFRRLLVLADFSGGSCRLMGLRTSIATSKVRKEAVDAEAGATKADDRSGC